MPLYLIERNYAERLAADAHVVGRILDTNKETGVHWLFSFLSADRRKTYCLYEAPNPEAIRDAAQRLHIPADVIMEVSEINPQMYLNEEEVAVRGGHPPVTAID
jgi:hypothetical protein